MGFYASSLTVELNQLRNQTMATSAINTEKSTSVIDTEKWKTRIDATATDIKEVKAFINWRLLIYKENR